MEKGAMSAHSKLVILFLQLQIVSLVIAASPEQWRSRSIYQIMTDRFADGTVTAPCDPAAGLYCGGTYQGIIGKLDYIQNMGFSAVWISPITKQLEGDTADKTSYHGYWQTALYDINPHFGSTNDLMELANALHARGMYLMLDIVVNHFASIGPGISVNYSQFTPFASEVFFHPFCEITNFSNPLNVQDCWLGDNIVSLPDLRTEDTDVASTFQTWINFIVAQYSIDGLRIDSAANVDSSFYPPFEDAAGVYVVGEVAQGDTPYTCSYQNYMDGVLNYPIFFPLTRAFQAPSGNISDLINQMSEVKSNCLDLSVLGSFSENHDQPRFASLTPDLSLAMNIITYTMLADGIPIIYEGQEQHLDGGPVPLNREAIWLTGYDTSSPLYTLITSLNKVRNRAIFIANNYTTYVNYVVSSDANSLVMRKGYDGSQTITILNNLGADGPTYTQSLSSSITGFQAGENITEMITCSSQLVDSAGNLDVAQQNGLPRVFYRSALLYNSGICGFPELDGASATTTSSLSSATPTSAAAPTATAHKTSSAPPRTHLDIKSLLFGCGLMYMLARPLI